MQDVASLIVTLARTMPVDTGVALTCNGVVVAKVRITGGVAFEVRSGSAALLFAPAHVAAAARAFLTEAHTSATDQCEKHTPVVRHVNGIALLKFTWNCEDNRQRAVQSVVDTLLAPPLCAKTSLEAAATPLATAWTPPELKEPSAP